MGMISHRPFARATSGLFTAGILGAAALAGCAEQYDDPGSIARAEGAFTELVCVADGTCVVDCAYDVDCCATADSVCTAQCALDGASDPDCAPRGKDCTYSHGYWKTHYDGAKNASQNIDWPKPGDEANLLCGKTWLGILQSAPKGGDAWTILGHQWISATLNRDQGASAPASVQQALRDGSDLLGTCGVLAGAAKTKATTAAGLLDQYNNGLIGPGHCD